MESGKQGGTDTTARKPESGGTVTGAPGRRRSAASIARSRRIWRSAGLTAAAFMCLASAAAGMFIGNIYFHSKTGKDIINKLVIQLLKHPLTDPLAAFSIQNQLPASKQSSINLLMLGCDVDYENDRPVILKNSRGRSDSIMIAKLDFANNTVNILSIPRDTAVQIPGHRVNKINAANALEGPDLTAETIKETFGIDTDYYVSINFETFKTIVDKMGGVDLTVEKQLDYDDDWGQLHVHLKPGYQHLTGYQAMGYVRIRHSDDDLHRAARQHAFLEAIRTKVKSREMFLKVPDLLNTLDSEVHRTEGLTMDQLIAIANWVRTVPKERVNMETMPSKEGRSYVTVDIPKAEETVKRLFFDDATPVTINAPGMAVVENITGGHGRKGRRKGKGAAAAAAVQGTDEPLVPTADGPEDVPMDLPDNPPAGTIPKKSTDPGDQTNGGSKTDTGNSGGDSKGKSDGGSKTDQKSGNETNSGV